MTFELFKWLTAIASLAGVILNIRHKRACFAVWFITNGAWAGIDAYYAIWPQAALQAVYMGLAAWGWFAWRRIGPAGLP